MKFVIDVFTEDPYTRKSDGEKLYDTGQGLVLCEEDLRNMEVLTEGYITANFADLIEKVYKKGLREGKRSGIETVMKLADDPDGTSLTISELMMLASVCKKYREKKPVPWEEWIKLHGDIFEDKDDDKKF